MLGQQRSNIINFSSLENLFFLFFFWQCGMWDLIPWFGIESMCPAMILRSPNQWTTKEDPWKSLLSPEAHSNIHIQTVKRGYSGLFLHVPLSMTLDDGKALFQQSETCFPPLPSTYHWYFVQVSVSQCKQNKTKKTLTGGISMISYIRFSFDCVWTPPFIQGHPQLGATESELEVIPSPSSRPFPQSCLPTQMPPSCSLFPQLPRSSLLCISSLISCAANPQPSPHLPQLARQVAQEKIAMGKDS